LYSCYHMLARKRNQPRAPAPLSIALLRLPQAKELDAKELDAHPPAKEYRP
jgi:hypothetical protein